MGFFSDATLSKTDRLVLFVLLVYCISGGILGFMMHNADRFPDIVLVNGSLDVLVVLSALAALWYGSRKGAIPLGQVGFSLGKGMWVNLGVIACCTALFWRQLPPTPLALSASSPWQILGAFIEEVVFRVYLIRILSLLISPRKGHVHWAVFLSAIIFTAVHLGRMPVSQLIGGPFLGSLIMGYITYHTRSVLSAAYIHVISNTGSELGLLGGGIAIAGYLVISLLSAYGRSRVTNLVGSEGS